jgi:hypothetical protein
MQRAVAMTTRLRRAALACGVGAALAFGAALLRVGARVFAVVHDTLEIFYGDRGDPVPVPDLGALLLLAVGIALTVGALALGIAARRAALALERASLIEQAN